MNLAQSIDFLSKPLIDLYADDFNEQSYWQPDWLKEAQSSPAISDFDLWHGIHTVSLQDGLIENDTDVFCEYYEEFADEVRTGIIEGWRSDVYVGEEDIERAIIRRANGSCDYVLESDILPLHEVIIYEPATVNALHPVSDTASGAERAKETLQYPVLLALQPGAQYAPVASGASA